MASAQRQRRAVTALGLVVALLLAGCASVQSFVASPRTVCAGDAVTVSWAAEGTVELQSEPPLPRIGPKEAAGSETFRPAQATRFSLRVTRLLSSETAEADVAVAPREREFGGLAMCAPAAGAVSLSVPLGESQLSSAIKLASVTNMNPRQTTISKGGVAAAIAPGGTSTEFRGQPAVGAWELRVPLAPGETCDAALGALANRLTFKLRFICGE
jgi:hypothetical protein